MIASHSKVAVGVCHALMLTRSTVSLLCPARRIESGGCSRSGFGIRRAYFYQGREMTRFGRVRSGVMALAVVLCVGMLFPACGFQEPTYRKSIDADDAAARVEGKGVHVPDGFTFSKGFVWPIASVGTSAFAIRYDGPADQFRTLRAADVGRDLIEFEDLPCASIPAPRASGELVELGLVCPAGGGSRITRTQRLYGGQSLDLGTHAVVLNPAPSHTQLFVLYAGT
ncbi:hypothetical protein AB4Z55_27300 [Gordonia sp. ABKF26]|uniref:hypothetical protein n=1 Tax=Gordonia sp. ABKF26 TaxID=3238687 RepID=UPI0034E4F28A